MTGARDLPVCAHPVDFTIDGPEHETRCIRFHAGGVAPADSAHLALWDEVAKLQSLLQTQSEQVEHYAEGSRQTLAAHETLFDYLAAAIEAAGDAGEAT